MVKFKISDFLKIPITICRKFPKSKIQMYIRYKENKATAVDEN